MSILGHVCVAASRRCTALRDVSWRLDDHGCGPSSQANKQQAARRANPLLERFDSLERDGEKDKGRAC